MTQCRDSNAKTTETRFECIAEQSLHASSSAQTYVCRNCLVHPYFVSVVFGINCHSTELTLRVNYLPTLLARTLL